MQTITLVSWYFLQVEGPNSALNLLKRNGANSVIAANRWPELYANNCTDIQSKLCHRKAFEEAYYGEMIQYLKVVEGAPKKVSKICKK